MIKTMHLLLFNNSRCHTRIPLQNFNIPQFKNPGFSRGSHNYFSKGAKNGEILFYPLETKKTAFFGENFIGKCHISKSMEGHGPPAPPSDGHVCKTYRYPNCWIIKHKTIKYNTPVKKVTCLR